MDRKGRLLIPGSIRKKLKLKENSEVFVLIEPQNIYLTNKNNISNSKMERK